MLIWNFQRNAKGTTSSRHCRCLIAVKHKYYEHEV